MEEGAENGKELSNSARANGMNEWMNPYTTYGHFPDSSTDVLLSANIKSYSLNHCYSLVTSTYCFITTAFKLFVP